MKMKSKGCCVLMVIGFVSWTLVFLSAFAAIIYVATHFICGLW